MELDNSSSSINLNQSPQNEDLKKSLKQISIENADTFIRYLPKDIEKYNESEVRNFLIKVYHENNNSQCKAKSKIELLNKYLIPLNKSHPELITNQLIKQVLTDYLPIVLPTKIIVENKNEDLSRYWSIYISFKVDGFVGTLRDHLKQLYSTIVSPNFEQYQYMIKYYKAVYPTLNSDMLQFKDYYCSMITDYYKNNINISSGVKSNHGENSIRMILEIWYSYLCLCGDQNQNQLQFAQFLTQQLKGEHLVDFICLFNKNYFDNPTFNMDAFILLVDSLFNDTQNKQFMSAYNDQHKKNTLLDIFKNNSRLNQFTKYLN